MSDVSPLYILSEFKKKMQFAFVKVLHVSHLAVVIFTRGSTKQA